MDFYSDVVSNLADIAEKHPEKLADQVPVNPKWKTLQQRLIDLYLEERKKRPSCKELISTSNLLAKLVAQDHLNTLVLNLYPGDEGYSLQMPGKNGADSETIRLPYEECDILDRIDNEELPPVLIDLLDRAQANIFYCGCVIVELRDYRRTTDGLFDTRYVILKPTPNTLVCDINSLTNDGHHWTQQDKFYLESQLLLHTSEPLCLDPSPAIFYAENELQGQRNSLNTKAVKRNVRKYSQASLNRKRLISQMPAPKPLSLHDFILKRKEKIKSGPSVNLKVGATTNTVDNWKQREVELVEPSTVEVEKYVKALEKPKFTYDHTPVTIEEYILETERSQAKTYLTKLTIQQRLTDDVYLGELYVDRDYVQGSPRGSTCRFTLGSKANVDKYIKQFTEIFTEEGRRSVKISHQRPGQQPIVTFTQNNQQVNITQAQQQANTQALIIQKAQNLAARLNEQGTKQMTPPIKLSLQIKPQTQGGSSGPQQVTLNIGSENISGLKQAKISRHMSTVTQNQPTGGNQYPQLPSYTQATTVNPLMKVDALSHTIQPQGQAQGQPQGQNLRRFTSTVLRGATSTAQPGSTTPTTPGNNTEAILRSDVANSSQQPPAPANTGQSSQVASAQQSVVATGHSPQVASGQSQSPASGQPAPPNINIASIAGLPQNINIQNLTGLHNMSLTNIQGIQGLHNVHMVGGMSVAGGIAVPLSVINTGTSSGLIVSSLAASSTSSSSLASSTVSGMENSSTQPTFVTMVTPSSVAAGGNIASASGGASTSGMVQVPITIAGNMTQILATTNFKNTSNSTLRHGAPLSFLQIPGQAQPVQLLGHQIAGGKQLPGGGFQQQTIRPGQPLTPQQLMQIVPPNQIAQQLQKGKSLQLQPISTTALTPNISAHSTTQIQPDSLTPSKKKKKK